MGGAAEPSGFLYAAVRLAAEARARIVAMLVSYLTLVVSALAATVSNTFIPEGPSTLMLALIGSATAGSYFVMRRGKRVDNIHRSSHLSDRLSKSSKQSDVPGQSRDAA